ncbi:MAG TPA: GNAT family N-acetyltransferase [Gaiellales bacterium]|nr:GNAT family N-acetyltransferase [Gaiellales bacterium]
MLIVPATTAADIALAAGLLDEEPRPDAVERFASDPGHHLLLAIESDAVVGFVSGVEMTHPDKGTEMFLYELGVAPEARSRGIGRALVAALSELAQDRGCYGMWVLTDDGNPAALRAYAAAGGVREHPDNALLSWSFSG